MSDEDRYQQVIIELSDGRTGVFMGPMLCDLSDDGKARVTRVTFTAPRPLPPGMRFAPFRDPSLPDEPPS